MAQGSIFEDLAPYASMIVDQGKGVTVSDLAFASAQDYWSTCAVAVNGSTAGLIDANSEENLFEKKIGDTGQGFTAALTISQTNNVNGDRMPANQVYVGLKAGFNLYHLNDVGTLSAYKLFDVPQDLAAVADNFCWSLNVGDGIKREIGSLLSFPHGCGVDSGTQGQFITAAGAGAGIPNTQGAQNGGPLVEMRKLPLPVIFPPNIKVAITAKCGNTFTLTSTTFWAVSDAVAIEMTFRGYMMTLPA